MDEFHQADPADLSSLWERGVYWERGCVWLRQEQAETLVGWASLWREWDREIKRGSSPECLVLGILGVVLADISVKGSHSRWWAGNRRLTPSLASSSVLSLYPQL